MTAEMGKGWMSESVNIDNIIDFMIAEELMKTPRKVLCVV